ncbi:MAG: PAS domain S-box protein [Tannerellaceae bacterium]|nr:PAS domain S-box protein [Tannerellaceae bacterium]
MHKNILLLLTGLLVAAVACTALGHRKAEKKHILVIHSYEQASDWMAYLERGIQECIRDSRLNVEIETIYLQDGVPDINIEAGYVRDQLDKYKDREPDLVFISGDEALLAFSRSGHPVSRNVPAIFTGVAYLPEELLKEHTNITGLTTTPDYEKCYQLARQLFGQIDEVILIAEDSEVGKKAIETARRQALNARNLTEVYESYRSFSETKTIRSPQSAVNPFKLRIERVDMLPGSVLKNVLYYKLNSFCILPVWYPSYTTLPRMGTAPFLMVGSEGFGGGQIGGYMTPGYRQGYDTMNIGVNLLRGDSVANYPITQSKQVPVFDWEQLHYWNINPELLPEDSIFVNMPVLTRYKMQIVAGSIIVSLLIILFTLMLVRLYRRESHNRRKAKEHLKKEQKELEITIESLNEGVVSIDTNGIILSMNESAIHLLGFDPKQPCTGMSVWSVFDIQKKNKPDFLKKKLENLSQTPGSHKLGRTAYVVTKDKKTFSVAGSISSLYCNETSCGAVLSFHDTTDEYIRKEYLALSMISGNIFACRYDQANRSVLFDELFFSTFDLHDDGSHSISIDDFIGAIHPEDRDKCIASCLEVLSRKKEKVTMQQRMDFTGKGYQWWEYRVSILPEATKESRYMLIGICINIEKFKQTEQELISLRDEAEKSDLMKSNFLANMSHEVRTPLNSIVGFSTLLIEGERLSRERRKEFMNIINRNCELLLNIINEILDISRIESGIVFRKDPCDLTRIMEEVSLHYISKDTEKENVQCTLDMPETPVVLQGDAFRLKQIMNHLLDNAFKFTEKGSITWGYRRDEEKDEVVLFVEDTGTGIANGYLPRIFDRFYKSDTFTQGGGLGLSIIYEIVKRMGGNIQVESELNAGTSFYVHLPAHEKEEEKREDSEYEIL